MKSSILILFLIGLFITTSSAQDADYLSLRWKEVATKMPENWYGSAEAKAVAENVILAQKEIGGWEKNKEYHQPLSDSEKTLIKQNKEDIGATFDNGATITELRFLAKIYAHIEDYRYKEAFEKGLNYIFISQYENGGWPQFFPVRTGSVAYSGHITYNDDAMVNTLKFLREIYSEDQAYSALKLDQKIIGKAHKSFNSGIDCILKTQIVVDGSPTVWCAQHDEKTLAPAKARSYELPSFSGSESVRIVQLLMELENPSQEVITAVDGAINWFENHKIEGIKLETEINAEGKKNRIIVSDPNASPIWARFYDLETGKPFFCDRDGIKKNSLAEIGYERRNGYSWYTSAPEKLLKEYPDWKKNVESN
ncbi:pectate lyase [Algoriphagus winogradskyi]|uniref:Pectate lyase, PelA/Pel-15E family n=1 Tax=Algoriphagus winogradskyi TaxID=237017 RepID=A0ABY1NEB9_9BACT|nr:pectate lyase [Algoriphagus winogradskyi]SMP05813.1 pectate lyase, PelA/Pel-15E family [Algoriphagus winogradskyi]